MRYKLFGRSGLRVSEISLGTMNFGTQGWGIDAQKSRSILDAYAVAGGNFLDTAHIYGGGESEKIVGDFIATERDNFVVATKYAPAIGGGMMKSGNSRRTMMRSVDESLKRLGTDRIDLFYLHMWDFTTPIEEIMRAFDDLVRMGKVLYIGISDTPAWQISRANMLAELRGWAPFIGIQIEYSLAERTPERDLLPMAYELDLGVVAWGPLAGGALAKRTGGPRDGMRAALGAERTAGIAAVVNDVADETGLPVSQVALAALRQLDPSGRMLPILGASSPEQLATNLGFLDVTLDEAQLARLDAVSRIDLGFPHKFLNSASIANIVTGGQADLLDNHRRPVRRI